MFSKEIFISRLKQLRLNNNLLQSDIAESLNTTKQTVSRWETGDRFPTIPALYALADYFDVSVDYLIGRTDTPKINEQQNN